MTIGWKIIEERFRATIILRHPQGAEAHFSEFAVGDLMMKHGLRRLPDDPFAALAWLVSHGLTPYKIVGDMPAGALPETRLLDTPR